MGEIVYSEGEYWHCSDLKSGLGVGSYSGSHGYLTDDFLQAILDPKHRPCVDVKTALDTTVAGIYAHMSALKGGETLRIPAVG